MTQKLPKEKNNVYNLTKKTKIVGVIKPAQNLLTNKRRTKNWANFASLLQENKQILRELRYLRLFAYKMAQKLNQSDALYISHLKTYRILLDLQKQQQHNLVRLRMSKIKFNKKANTKKIFLVRYQYSLEQKKT